MSTHIPTPTLALFVPLQPKSSALGDFLKAGRSLAVEEEGTLQWLALKYKGADTYAIFDTFPDAASRNAHMTGKIPDALMATAESLITQAPDMVEGQASILASKVHTPESGTLKCGLFVKINDTSDELKQFLIVRILPFLFVWTVFSVFLLERPPPRPRGGFHSIVVCRRVRRTPCHRRFL